MSKQTKIDPTKELDKIKGQQRNQLEKEGKRPYLILEEDSVTKIKVLTEAGMREEEGDFGLKKIFRVEAEDGKEYDLPCSMSLAKKILYALQDGINPMEIMRVGKDKQTRYSIKGQKRKK